MIAEGLLAATPPVASGPAALEWVGLGALVLVRLLLSGAATTVAVPPIFLSRRRPAERAGDLDDPVSSDRMALRLARALSLAVATAWAVSLAYRSAPSGTTWLVFGAIGLALVLLADGVMMTLLARRFPGPALALGLPLVRVASLLLAPISIPLARSLSGSPGPKETDNGARDEKGMEEELKAFIDAGEARGILEGEEGELVQQIVTFGDTIVREVMTPRTEMVSIAESAGVGEARRLFIESRHSRLPVFRKDLDDMVGVLSVRDLLEAYSGGDERGAPLADLMRPVHLVPETRKVVHLLRDLQRGRAPLAVVVDEYGGTAGLVTIEDLLEEIVGEIMDEHETGEPIASAPEGGWLVDGLCSVEDLEEVAHRELRREGIDSVGGLVFSAMGRLPEVGEAVVVSGLELKVLELDDRRIARVHVRWAGPASDRDGEAE